jgi:glycosyltransferase involved in cell wall biosynthesis
VAALRRDLRRVGAEGVLVYPFGLHILVALAARAAGISRVLVHAGNPPPIDRRQRQVWKAIVHASRLLRVPIKSCSAMVSRELRALAGTLPAGSEILHNGVDVDAIASVAGAARRKRAPGDPRVIGMVARLNAIKDHDTLLRAFARVRPQAPDCELWLIGDGERRATLTALAEQLAVAASVRFWGDRADVHSLLGAMDLFVMSTTRDEGFGIALAEAMAARTPIIASDVEACREVLAQGEVGKLVAPHSVDELATAMSELLARPDVARDLADRAFSWAKLHLDIAQCAERYYAAFVSSRRRGRHG